MIPIERARLFWTVIGLAAILTALPAVTGMRSAAAAAQGGQSYTVENELSTRNVRTEESSLANLVVDAIRAVEKTDAAFMHASAFADTTVAKGKASPADIVKAIQYREDTVVVVKLTGAQIRKALENGLKLYPQKSPEFLQVSGISVTVDPDAEKDKRVIDVKIGGAKLADGKTYTVAMPSPLANGALGYYKIWDKAQAIDHETTKTVGQALTDYLSGRTSLTGKTEDRIVFKS